MKLYTADICDQYGDDIQVLEPIFKCYGGAKKCSGAITTIELYEDNGDLVKLLRDEQGEGKICVVNVVGDYCAVVGENLMKFAHKNGWGGIVINGYVRDTEMTEQIPVGLFALGTYPYKSRKTAEAKRAIELSFAGVVFKEGNYLYADRDGIIISDKNFE
jgi:regulator of ribonuclease activity A